MKKSIAPLIIILIIAVVLAVGGGAYYYQKYKAVTVQPKTNEIPVNMTPAPTSTPVITSSPATTSQESLGEELFLGENDSFVCGRPSPEYPSRRCERLRACPP